MSAEAFIREFIPHAPHYGLYVKPDIPANLLQNALRSYAKSITDFDVIALYDATLLNSGRDGAVFLREKMVFRNSNLDPAQEFQYDDVIKVRSRRRLLGGRQLVLKVNRGQATIQFNIDFSGKPKATEYVERLLQEILYRGLPTLDGGESVLTDVAAVQEELDKLRQRAVLSDEDYDKMMAVLRE